MNDVIKPFDIDFTKRLHGHVRVETRSRWTGRVVDSQEKDNLVTDAVRQMLMTAGWANGSGGFQLFITPLWEKALGGLMLFDNTLTEQASNIHFPASTKLVGFAGQGANSTDARAGSLNTAESVQISNGFTSVWDFLTSQANGTIASLARTSSSILNGGGYYGGTYADLRLGGMGNARYLYYLGYDATNKYVYFAFTNSVNYEGVTYPVNTIYRAKCNLNEIDMSGNFIPTPDKVEAVKVLSSSDGSTSARNYVYDKWANNFVYSYNNTTIHIVAIDGTHTTKTATGTSGTVGFAISENYYWKANATTVYRIDKTNTANVKSYTMAASEIYAGENDICFAMVGSTINIIYPDDTIIPKPITGTATLWARQLGPFYVGGTGNSSSNQSANYCYPVCNYLGTIANLDSPVTKTSSQTMKITYTLTEA